MIAPDKKIKRNIPLSIIGSILHKKINRKIIIKRIIIKEKIYK